jgi:hypothetical protein
MAVLRKNNVSAPRDEYIAEHNLGAGRSGLVLGADGGLDIFVQAKSPGAEHESNCLPTSESEFFMFTGSLSKITINLK